MTTIEVMFWKLKSLFLNFCQNRKIINFCQNLVLNSDIYFQPDVKVLEFGISVFLPLANLIFFVKLNWHGECFAKKIIINLISQQKSVVLFFSWKCNVKCYLSFFHCLVLIIWFRFSTKKIAFVISLIVIFLTRDQLLASPKS